MAQSAAGGAPPSQSSQSQITAANQQLRAMVNHQAVDMWSTIYTNTITSGPGTVINVPIRNVGLVKRFWVRIRATIGAVTDIEYLTSNHANILAGHANGGFGAANFFSNVTLFDFSNQQRINTAGWHLAMVASAKRRRPFLSGAVLDTGANQNGVAPGNAVGFGVNWDGSANPGSGAAIVSPTSVLPAGLHYATPIVNAGDVGELDTFFEVPCSYTDKDLRGAMFANMNNATATLQLTVNPNLFVPSGAGVDSSQACYQSSGAVLGTLPTFDIEVIQNYLYQLPRDPKTGKYMLPPVDLSTAYMLSNTVMSGLVATQNNPISYANFREFMSTVAQFENTGQANGNLQYGGDVNYWALLSANFTPIWQIGAKTAAAWARSVLGTDPPQGVYYFDHRHKPITLKQYGNIQLSLNPLAVGGSTSTVYIGWESLGLINQVTGAGSLFGT